jgi:uncharacterized membrane protein
MPRFTISASINRPKDVVELAYFRPENMPAWTKNLVSVEVVSGKLGEIGSVARLHYIENGREYTLEDRLEYYDPGKKIRSQVSGAGMLILVETTMEQIGDTTEVTLSWSGKGTRFPMNVIIPLMGTRIRGSALEELLMFKELVETYGAIFPENPAVEKE